MNKDDGKWWPPSANAAMCHHNEAAAKRAAAFKAKGCIGHVAEVNKANCSFPTCACFPFWREVMAKNKV